MGGGVRCRLGLGPRVCPRSQCYWSILHHRNRQSWFASIMWPAHCPDIPRCLHTRDHCDHIDIQFTRQKKVPLTVHSRKSTCTLVNMRLVCDITECTTVKMHAFVVLCVFSTRSFRLQQRDRCDSVTCITRNTGKDTDACLDFKPPAYVHPLRIHR